MPEPTRKRDDPPERLKRRYGPDNEPIWMQIPERPQRRPPIRRMQLRSPEPEIRQEAEAAFSPPPAPDPEPECNLESENERGWEPEALH